MENFKNKILVICFTMSSFVLLQAQNFTQYVDPIIGTGEHGHVFLGANVPYGAVQLGPTQIAQTWDKFNGWDWCSGYNYKSKEILGFPITHVSGTGIGDLNDVMIVPANGILQLNPAQFEKMNTGYGSYFSHENEKVRPGYYSVYLDKYKIKVNLTASKRVGYHQYTYTTQTDNAHILIDLAFKVNWDKATDTYIKQINDSTFVGYRFSTGWANDQKLYFAIKTSVPIQKVNYFNDSIAQWGNVTAKGKGIKAVLYFDAVKNNTIELKVGISSVSTINALANIEAEIPDWNFEKVKTQADEEWNKVLSKITVEGTPDNKKMFYTSVYHSYFAPTIFDDVNGDYLGTDKQVYAQKDFTNYTLFSLWDTYRTFHPLKTITEDPKVIRDFIKSFIAIYEQQGHLPIWHLQGNETNTMVGLPAIPVIADAVLKGLLSKEEEQLAWQAVKATAMGYNEGLHFTVDLSFIPTDSGVQESVSKGLEYAIADYGAYKIAEKLGQKEDAEYFKKRYKLYEKYFDKESGHFVGRYANGKFRRPFNPLYSSVGQDFTEGNAWQYTWLVPHDVRGLINLLGGEQKFIQKLDQLIALPSKLEGDAPPDISGLIGQYAQGNEPNHHILYLYAYVGQQWKSAALVRRVMAELFSTASSGVCGNEDAGQMSAWYILSAIGFYPVNPINGVYVFGSPLMDKVTINLPNNNKFIMNVKNQGSNNLYIKSVKFNGKPYDNPFITHNDIMEGGQLDIEMSDKPNKNFGKKGIN